MLSFTQYITESDDELLVKHPNKNIAKNLRPDSKGRSPIKRKHVGTSKEGHKVYYTYHKDPETHKFIFGSGHGFEVHHPDGSHVDVMGRPQKTSHIHIASGTTRKDMDNPKYDSGLHPVHRLTKLTKTAIANHAEHIWLRGSAPSSLGGCTCAD